MKVRLKKFDIKNFSRDNLEEVLDRSQLFEMQLCFSRVDTFFLNRKESEKCLLIFKKVRRSI